MTYVAHLERTLPIYTINLGFSGNGQMQPTVTPFLAAIPADLFVIQALPNMNASMVMERTIPLVKQIRRVQPRVPIVLCEGHTYDTAWIAANIAREQAATSSTS
jgi:hypothetical protein